MLDDSGGNSRRNNILSHGGRDIIIFDVVPTPIATSKVPVGTSSQDIIFQKLSKGDKWIDSSINSILLQQILNYCTPVIKSIPKVIISINDLKKKTETNINPTAGISIIFDRDMHCFLEKGNHMIKVAKNQLVTVIGIRVNVDVRSNNWIDVYDYLNTARDAKRNKWIPLSRSMLTTILRTGLYGSYNLYKDYFSYPYICNPVRLNYKSDCFNISLAKSVDENNKAITNFYQTYIGLNDIYSNIYPIYAKSLYVEHESQINSNSRFFGYSSEADDQIEWLIKSKILSRVNRQYLILTVEVRTLITKIKWYGAATIDSKPYIEKLKFIVASAAMASAELIKNKKKSLEVNLKKSIAFKKYGTEFLTTLSANQLRLVVSEYKNITDKHTQQITAKIIGINNFTTSISNSRQGADIYLHQNLEYILANLPSTSKAKFEKLIGMPAEKNTIMVPIKLGSEPGEEICPHLIELGMRLAKTQPGSRVTKSRTGKAVEPPSQQLLDISNEVTYIYNDILNKYAAAVGDQSSNISKDLDNYCAVCGALLAEYDEEEISYKERDNYVLDIEDDEIFLAVKKELQYILDHHIDIVVPANSSTSAMFKQERSMVDALKTIIELLAGIIRNKIAEIQADLIKIKTMNENDMWVVLNIYIYIYIFALLAQFIFTNSNMLQFRGFDIVEMPPRVANRRGDKHGGRVAVDSKGILSSLLKSKHSKDNLEKIINFALDLVKRIKFADIAGSKYININNIKDLFLVAYKWTLAINYSTLTVDGKSSGEVKEEIGLDSNNILTYFKLYGKVGRTNEQIEKDFIKSIPIYSTVVLNKSAPASARAMYDYIVNERYLEKPVPDNPEIDKTYSDFIKIKKKDIAANAIHKVMVLKPYLDLVDYELRQSTAYVRQLPFKLVGKCEKGCNKLYVYRSGKKIKEATKKEIVSWVCDKEFSKLEEIYKMELLGSKCICKSAKSPQVGLFYKYFEQYCPKGELHDYGTSTGGTSGKCKKCGITNDIISSMDTQYYNKWKDLYTKTRSNETAQIDKEMNIRLNAYDTVKRPAAVVVPNWKISNKDTTELSKLFNIKNLYNLFCSIGLYENNEYAKIEGNKIQPFLNAAPNDYWRQATAAHNYVLYINRHYYTTKNSEYLVKIPYDLKNMLEKMTQSNRNFAKLPDLDLQHISHYNYYIGACIKPELLANFAISALAGVFLQIYAHFKTAKLEKFGQTWCQFYLAKIIGFEKFACVVKLKSLKPLSKYQDDDLAEDTRVEDVEMIDSDADGDGRIAIDDAVAEEYDEVGDVFAFADMDIELGEDGEENLYDNKILEGK